MDRKIFDQILKETENAVNNFKIEDWKSRGLFQRFNELYKMIDGYSVKEEQKVYLFRKGILLLAIESVHDIFPAEDYFRKNPEERFLVFRTPGQEKNEGQIDEWVTLEKENWARQGEVGGEEATLKGGRYWN